MTPELDGHHAVVVSPLPPTPFSKNQSDDSERSSATWNSRTVGAWDEERDAARAFDERVEGSGLFSIYREVSGDLVQPRSYQRSKRVRIDRVLVPTPKLAEWTGGCVGVEFKRSDKKIGRPFSQMLDYARAQWELPRGIRVGLNFVFLWPSAKQSGDIASVCAQQRIGTALPTFDGIDVFCGEVRVLTIRSTGFHIGNINFGEAVGSR